jgi:hypothetical protein
VETPVEGSNPVKGSKSCIDFISRIDFINRKKVKNRIKARKADGEEPKVWPIGSFVELPYELRFKSQKKIEFSDTIIKMAKAILVAEVEEELEEGEP